MFALDIGCGENTEPALGLAEKGYTVFALENNPNVVKDYQKRLENSESVKRSHVNPIIADARFLPFREESLDLIIAYYAFDWISILGEPADIKLASEEAKRVLKSGCKLIVHEYWERGGLNRSEALRMAGFTVESGDDDEVVLIAVKQKM